MVIIEDVHLVAKDERKGVDLGVIAGLEEVENADVVCKDACGRIGLEDGF